jgi:hypothetical protein
LPLVFLGEVVLDSLLLSDFFFFSCFEVDLIFLENREISSSEDFLSLSLFEDFEEGDSLVLGIDWD